MDTFQNPPANQTELADLKSQCASLRQMLGSLLVLVIILSGTLNIYLWRQFRMTRAELKVLRPQIGQMIADYQRVTVPAVTDFIKKLNDYERTHPDFTQIMVKYNLKAALGTNAAPIALPSSKK